MEKLSGMKKLMQLQETEGKEKKSFLAPVA